MTWALLFRRLIVRPLIGDPLRTVLTVFTVSLGVAVVVAIDLAAEASAGSFRSSMESLTGEAQYEINAVGGLDETVLADLYALPYDLGFSPRVEGFARLMRTGETVPLFGVDLIGDATLERATEGREAGQPDEPVFPLEGVTADTSVWAGSRVADSAGQKLAVQLDDRVVELEVQGVLEGSGFQGVSIERALLMDISGAQRALDKSGLLDRVQVFLPEGAEAGPAWRERLASALPEGVQVSPIGSAESTNRKMLGAFRWNLRVLSYLSLLVGAFLIYNTISVSVVRRRVEIGVLRAIGASRGGIRGAFLAEGAFFGALGTMFGLVLGRFLATGAVDMMALTVSTLYVSGEAAEIELNAARLGTAAVAGVGVALLAAWQPASEAASVPPTEAMARGRADYGAGVRVNRDLAAGLALAAVAALCSLAPQVKGLPLFGYAASVLLLVASALMVPAVIRGAVRAGNEWLGKVFGVEAFLGARGVGAALSRTAILVGALSTAVAMMVSVGVMVGSFRETVLLWMDKQLQADLFIRPAGDPASDQFPLLSPQVAETAAKLDGVAGMDAFRGYPIEYNGREAVLGAGTIARRTDRIRFLRGDADEILGELPTCDCAVVSEPFARKHDVWPGDELRLPLRGREVAFEVLGVFYDYSSERGAVIVDRGVLLEYLPDTGLNSIALYLEDDVDPDETLDRLVAALPGSELYVATNGRLRREAIAIFDQTFAITYALEAVAVVVAVLGMAGALVALVIDRKREIAVLRFLGASAKQLRKLILAESGLLGLLAVGVGGALGTALSLILIFVINRQSFGWTIQFHWPVALLLGALALVYLASLLAGLYPARLAARLSAIEAVHEG